MPIYSPHRRLFFSSAALGAPTALDDGPGGNCSCGGAAGVTAGGDDLDF